MHIGFPTLGGTVPVWRSKLLKGRGAVREVTVIPEDSGYKIPVDLCRHAAMKRDSFITDIHEIKEDEGLSPDDRPILEQIAEMSGTMLAAIINMAAKEVGEEELLSWDTVMDENGRR